MKRFLIAGLTVLVAASMSSYARAATYNIADGDVAGLIAAINASNASTDPDTINLARRGTYILTYIAGPDSWHGPTGLPIVQGSSETQRSFLTINGNGSTIQRSDSPGTAEFRIFHALYANVTLDSVVIKGGRGQGSRCGGGGLYLNVSNTVIRNSTITENWGLEGGGICNNNSSTLTIENSTISYNTGVGGRTGGGILNFSGGLITITSSTIYENQADGSPGFEGRGDAIADAFSPPGSTVIKNSIVASPTRGIGIDCIFFTPVSLGHNIFSDTSCGQSVAGGDLIVPNLALGPLADNGGLTPTHALLSGSPAKDAIPAGNCILIDQRDVARPQGAKCDIGAVEVSGFGDFSAAEDFSILSNPNGTWSYGYAPPTASTFSLLTLALHNSYFNITPLPIDIWTRLSQDQPSIMSNNGERLTQQTLRLPRSILLMHPGPTGEKSVLRWTAPAAGVYQFLGNFQGLDFVCGPTSDASIIHNGSSSIFATSVNFFEPPHPFDLTQTMQTGDTIDFAVGYGGNHYFCDSTGLTVDIVTVSLITDSTPPAVMPSVVGTLGNNGWYTSDVQVAWSVSEEESPVSSSTGCDLSSVAIDTTGTTFTCSATSGGGTNTQSVTIKRDATAPVINIASPANGTYLLNQSVSVDFACSDSVSSVASCAGSAANGSSLDTGSPGSKSFTVDATDNAGNEAQTVITYTVGFGIEVLFDQTKAHKSGSTVPIKVRLVDANGTNVSSANSVLHAVSVVQTSSQAATTLDDSGNSNPDFDFRYDASLGGYIFNLKTSGYGTGTYLLHFVVGNDPTNYSVGFQVRQ